MGNMRMRHGVHGPLEEEADRLIKESLKDVTRHADKSDILTPWKEKDRYKREIYVASGTPEAMLRKGDFHRAYNPRNPHLNSPGVGGSGRKSTRMAADLQDEPSSTYRPSTWNSE